MSIISIVYLPEGIIVAADSRLTGKRTEKDANGVEVTERFPRSDNAQKIVLLEKCSVGIASCGTALVDGKTIADYIRLFEINDVKEGDTPEAVANKLFSRKDEYPGTTFYVCGYCQDIPYVYSVTTAQVTRANVDGKGCVKYSIGWGGEKEALNKLINASPVMPINECLMPLKDGIDFAEFMVDLTIKYQRFSDRIKTCGGPIDILVLTKDKAFWYKNKLYT